MNSRPTFSHQDLDTRLRPTETDPARFEELADALVCELDLHGVDLEVTDPLLWRRVGAFQGDAPVGAFVNQFRAEVERIERLDREDEARLARRIEFARRRYEAARELHGLTEEQVLEGLAHPTIGWNLEAAAEVVRDSELPRPIPRRWVELHGLRTEMVERSLYLVPINVERYAQTGASRIDLIQEGSIALYRAVDGFDWRRGLLFRTYAVHWLNQAFRNYLYNFGHTVRVPVYLQKAMKHIQEARVSLGDPTASVLRIADEGHLDPHLVETAIAAVRGGVSLDRPADGDGGRLADYLEDDGGMEDELERLDRTALESTLLEAFEGLKERERFVLVHRFGLGKAREHTLAEVADLLGISVERVRQIQIGALRRLAAPDLRAHLLAFLN